MLPVGPDASPGTPPAVAEGRPVAVSTSPRPSQPGSQAVAASATTATTTRTVAAVTARSRRLIPPGCRGVRRGAAAERRSGAGPAAVRGGSTAQRADAGGAPARPPGRRPAWPGPRDADGDRSRQAKVDSSRPRMGVVTREVGGTTAGRSAAGSRQASGGTTAGGHAGGMAGDGGGVVGTGDGGRMIAAAGGRTGPVTAGLCRSDRMRRWRRRWPIRRPNPSPTSVDRAPASATRRRLAMVGSSAMSPRLTATGTTVCRDATKRMFEARCPERLSSS